MENTMTKREFLNAVKHLDIDSIPGEDKLRELREYAKATLEKMDADAEKRKGHKTEKQKAEAAEKDARATEVAHLYLSNEAKTATDVMELLNANEGTELKVQSVSAMLKRAVALGVANVEKVKIPKKGEQNGYTFAE